MIYLIHLFPLESSIYVLKRVFFFPMQINDVHCLIDIEFLASLAGTERIFAAERVRHKDPDCYAMHDCSYSIS